MMRKTFACWLVRGGVLVALVGCAASGDPDDEEAVATTEEELVAACGNTGVRASGSGSEAAKELLEVCLANDATCIATLKAKHATYDCQKERWKVYNRALAKAGAQCNQRLQTAAAGLECPCQCPKAGLFTLFCPTYDDREKTAPATKVPGIRSAAVQTGTWAEDPRYYGAWCEISASATSSGTGTFTCSGASTCGEAGAEGGTSPEAGVPEGGDETDWKKHLLESSFTGA